MIEDFKASDGWLDKWTLSYRIWEKNRGELFDAPLTMIEQWMERLR